MFGARASALRVKVKKCEGTNAPEWRKFSVDPQITSLEVLYSLLAKAFELNQDFGISYKTINPQTNVEQFLIILSDWDLEAAFLRSHNQSVSTGLEPCLNLQIDVKLFSEAPDWDANINNSATSTLSALTGGMTNVQQAGQKYVQNVQNKLPGLSGFLQGQIEKSFSIMTRALNFVDDPSMNSSPRPPLTDNEFRYYCDSVGQIIHQNELRKVIYSGGIDGSLRRVVWKHILNVYPGGLTGKERMDYIKRKSMEYISMREVWRLAVQQGTAISGELAYVTSMVRKDVLRTDRLHPFYSGSDDNQNIGALFNVLTTYALNHPSVSYCQGMSDIASPLLVTMCDEAQAYICFCAIMSRMKNNFMIDGIAMTQNFAHLSEAIQYYDMEFYNYLKLQQADDLLFCYRWLLLEMKREFAFEDSLRCLEVMWSSLPPNPPDKELQLFEKEFVIVPVETEPVPERTENPYTKLCALRRQNSAISLSSNPITINQIPKLDNTKRMNQSLDESIMNDVVDCKKEIRKGHQSLDETKILLLRQKNILNGESSPGIYENCEMLNSDCKTESSIDDISEHTEKEKNPFLYSDSSVDKDEIPSPVNSTDISLVSKEKAKSIGGHFKDLKEKLSAGKKGIMTTIEKLECDYDPVNIPTNEVKLVKNFNEFLNFASGAKKDISPTTGEEKLSINNAVDSNKSKELTDEISPDDSQDYFPMTTSITRDLKIEMDNLNRQVFGQNYHQFKAEVDSPQESYGESPAPVKSAITNISYIQLDHQKSASLDAIEVDNEEEVKGKVKMRKRELNDETALNRFSVASSTNNDVFIWQNPLHGSSDCILSHIPMTPSPANATTPDEHDELEYDGEIIEMDHGKKSVTPIRMLRKKRDVNDKTLTSEVDSDSEDENEKKWSHEHQLKLNSNNPFFDQIQQMSAKEKSEEEVLECGGQMNSCEEASEISNNSTVPNKPKQTVQVNNQQPEPVASTRSTELPPPHEFGNGNPFLMFLCLTLLIQHRDYIMKTGMDYNEMAMHFDKMVRKHNVTRVLSQARRLYQDYLRSHNERMKQTTTNNTINSTKI